MQGLPAEPHVEHRTNRKKSQQRVEAHVEHRTNRRKNQPHVAVHAEHRISKITAYQGGGCRFLMTAFAKNDDSQIRLINIKSR